MIVQFEVMYRQKFDYRRTVHSPVMTHSPPPRLAGPRQRRKARSLDSGASCHDYGRSARRDRARSAPALASRGLRLGGRRGRSRCRRARRDLRADTNPSASDRCAPPPSAPQTARTDSNVNAVRSVLFPPQRADEPPPSSRLQASHSNFRTSSPAISRRWSTNFGSSSGTARQGDAFF